MVIKKTFFAIAGFFLLFQPGARAQQFSTQGSALQTGPYTYTLTPNESSQAGMATNLYPLDLTKNFTINLLLNFGTNDGTGGDGFAFLMSTICNPVLPVGSGLGVKGIPNSLVVEFDSWDDQSVLHDISNDHLGIYMDGVLDATGYAMDGNTSPICLLADCGNVENGRWYTASLKWEYISPAVQKLNVFFGDVLRATSTGNHIANRFANNPFVFWSVAGATGTGKNLQQFGIESNNDNNINTCEGASFTLRAPTLATNYSWSNGSSSTTNTATYTAITNDVITCNYTDYCGVPRTVFFTITVHPNPSVSVNNPVTCAINPALLMATPTTNAVYSYQWTVPSGVQNPGDVPSFPVSNAGLFSVVITNTETGCRSTPASGIVTSASPIDPVFAVRDSFCQGEAIADLPTISLNGIRGTWVPAMNTQQTTTYRFTPDTGQCAFPLTKTIVIQDNPFVDFGTNQKICLGESILLDPVARGNDLRFLWQDGSSDSVLTTTQPGLYTVTVSNSCGADTATMLLEETSCGVYVPSAFTPNADGLNDVFRMNAASNINQFRMQIFNRWGKQIFQTTNPLEGWDGGFNGKKQPPGVYIYRITFTNRQTGIENQLNGTVTLL